MTQDNKHDTPLEQRLRRLPTDVPPGRDLWPSIEARLGQPAGARPAPPRRWVARPLLALAASLAIAAVLVLMLFGRHAPDAPQTAQQQPAPVSQFGPAYQLDGGYQAARAGLLDDLEQQLAHLDPAARAAVLENLETIRRAVTEINAALGDDPANVLLQNQLLATYQDELSVLANLQRVTPRPPTRNDI